MPVSIQYDVFRQLASEGVTLRAAAHFGEGLAAARWARNETAETSYILPNHHTLSLYAAGGDQIRRRDAGRELRSFGTGSLCLMPEDVTSDWHVAGPVDLFHLYIPKRLFERIAAGALNRDPALITLPERTFFADPALEAMIRLSFLDRKWDEPAESLALSSAGHMLIAYLIGHYSTASERMLFARGGLPPRVLRRVEEYVEANLAEPMRISDLASVAGLSEFHFARMFKSARGEAPHSFVMRQRIERAKRLLAETGKPVALIALVCGFANQSHFAANFRKLTGVSPRLYRTARRSL
jgi:AraC family transcriptional regulator